MIKNNAKKLFDVIIVWKLDRFARKRYDSAHYKAVLRKNGVKVMSATERIAEDSTGILLESLLEGYAEFYSAELAEKVTRSMTENALKCKYNGGPVPVGYVIDSDKHFRIDPLTAPVVLEAFKKYDKGATVTEIVKFMAEKGIRTKFNKPMLIDAVNRMLKNRRFLGEYIYMNIVQPGGIPAIVSKDLFERVQEKMVKNKKASARKKKTVKKNWIEDIVVNETMNILADDSVLEYITELIMGLQAKENTDLPRFKEQLDETEKAINNMLNAIQQGIFNRSTKGRLDELEAVKSDLETKILQEEIQRPTLTKEKILFWLHKFRGIDTSKHDKWQWLIDTFINAIYLDDDKIFFTFNY